MIPDDLAEPGSTPTVAQPALLQSSLPANIWVAYNEPRPLAWPKRLQGKVFPWANCGNETQPARPQTFPPGTPRAMLDREVYEQQRLDRADEWGRLLDYAMIGNPDIQLVAYDPFGWDPAKLRRTTWSSLPLSAFAAHMRSRRALLPYLEDFTGLATDVYPPKGYTLVQYTEWATLKIQAHYRLCSEAGKAAMILLALEPSNGADGIAMQAGLIRRTRATLGLELVNWVLWGWAHESDTAKQAQHVGAAYQLLQHLDSLGVPTT